MTREDLADQAALGGIAHGWPAVLADPTSLLQAGEVLPEAPWGMAPAGATS